MIIIVVYRLQDPLGEAVTAAPKPCAARPTDGKQTVAMKTDDSPAAYLVIK